MALIGRPGRGERVVYRAVLTVVWMALAPLLTVAVFATDGTWASSVVAVVAAVVWLTLPVVAAGLGFTGDD